HLREDQVFAPISSISSPQLRPLYRYLQTTAGGCRIKEDQVQLKSPGWVNHQTLRSTWLYGRQHIDSVSARAHPHHHYAHGVPNRKVLPRSKRPLESPGLFAGCAIFWPSTIQTSRYHLHIWYNPVHPTAWQAGLFLPLPAPPCDLSRG